MGRSQFWSTVGPSWIILRPAYPPDNQIGIWGIWRLGQRLELFVTTLGHPWTVVVVFQEALLCWGNCCQWDPLSCCHKGLYFVCDKVWAGCAYVKLHPHEWQDPVFLSRAFHRNKMIIVIPFSCEWFECCGWQVLQRQRPFQTQHRDVCLILHLPLFAGYKGQFSLLVGSIRQGYSGKQLKQQCWVISNSCPVATLGEHTTATLNSSVIVHPNVSLRAIRL